MNTYWQQNAFFYHIYPFGFCGAPSEHGADTAADRLAPLFEVTDHLLDLGVRAVYIGPVFESAKHGYDTTSYTRIDPRLGTNEGFRNLIRYWHENNIRVVLDGVFNHVGRGFDAFRDLQEHGERSVYRDWFKDVDFSQHSPLGDRFTYEAWEGHFELVTLNLENPEVRKHIFEAVVWMLDWLAIDGIRLDVAYLLPKDFLAELRTVVDDYTTTHNRDRCYLLGEVIHGDYNEFLGPDLLDAVTNYECFKGMWSSLNDANYHEIAHSLSRQFGNTGGDASGGPGAWSGISAGHLLYNFVENHDVDRAASVLKNPAHLFPLYGMLFTIPGSPSVYYGGEFGLHGSKASGGDSALRPSWKEVQSRVENGATPESQGLPAFIHELASVRERSNALCLGDLKPLLVDHEQMVWLRRTDSETVLVAVNAAADPVTLELSDLTGTVLKPIMAQPGELYADAGTLSLPVPALGTAIYQLV
ncbi:MAG: alpha-amylase family glycosyl hydrolase [Spirochaetaceae bacterium]